jgi:hypothetical protein
MNAQQLCLLNHATQMLDQQAVPYNVDTETAARLLEVSPTTLNKAKKVSQGSHSCKLDGFLVTAQFIEQKKRKDWWCVKFKTLKEGWIGKNKD